MTRCATARRPAGPAIAAIAHVDLSAFRGVGAFRGLTPPRLDRLPIAPAGDTPAVPSGALLLHLLIALATVRWAWRPRRRSH